MAIRPQQQGQGNNPGNNLHVSGLSTRVDDRDLDEVFSKFGRVMRDPHTKDSRGFAFVTMETAEEADAAIVGLNATELMGRTMNVEKARRGRARTPTPGQYHGPPKRGDSAATAPTTLAAATALPLPRATTIVATVEEDTVEEDVTVEDTGEDTEEDTEEEEGATTTGTRATPFP
uniref:RRM domain-containing protein n=1 Tax=Leucosporidium scottii TaxID=5278 RepID=A0A0H5FRX6_9BASI|nr:hypothetical protein ls5930a1_00129 [Leucosporidium scottii]